MPGSREDGLDVPFHVNNPLQYCGYGRTLPIRPDPDLISVDFASEPLFLIVQRRLEGEVFFDTLPSLMAMACPLRVNVPLNSCWLATKSNFNSNPFGVFPCQLPVIVD